MNIYGKTVWRRYLTQTPPSSVVQLSADPSRKQYIQFPLVCLARTTAACHSPSIINTVRSQTKANIIFHSASCLGHYGTKIPSSSHVWTMPKQRHPRESDQGSGFTPAAQQWQGSSLLFQPFSYAAPRSTGESLSLQTQYFSTVIFLLFRKQGIGSAVLLCMMPLQLRKSTITAFG